MSFSSFRKDNTASNINMVIILEPGLTEEQKSKAIGYNKAQDEDLKAKNPELFMLCKNFWRLYKNEILSDSKNAHLKKAIEENGDDSI